MHPWQKTCLLATPLTDICPLAKPLGEYFSIAKPLQEHIGLRLGLDMFACHTLTEWDRLLETARPEEMFADIRSWHTHARYWIFHWLDFFVDFFRRA
jgi:hypothetical protein